MRAPVYKIYGEDYEYLFEQIRVNGYRRARIDGKPRDLGDHIDLDEDEAHTVEAVIDSFVVGPGIDQQVVTSLEHGLKLGDGLLGFHIVKPKQLGGEHKKFYDGFGCAGIGLSPAKCTRPSSRSMTRRAPAQRARASARRCGCIRRCWCPIRSERLNEGAFVTAALSNSRDSWGGRLLHSLAAHYGFSLDTPFRIWPRSTCKCCFTARRGNSSKSSCRRGRS